MTKEQRNLVLYWIFGAFILLAAICTSLLDVKYQQFSLVGVLVLFGFVSMFQDFSHYRGYGSGREMIGEFVESHPRLKIYLVIYCVAALPYLIYKIHTYVDYSGLLYFISFFGLTGPIVYISEVERFKSMGSEDA